MKFKNILKNCLLTAATTLVLATSAQAELQDRIIHTSNGDVKAFYDTDINITWLGDANYAKTHGDDADGKMSHAVAKTWANQLVIGQFSDWRLPTTMQPDQSCDIQLTGFSGGRHCTGSEMGHLFYTVLNPTLLEAQNSNKPLVNFGNFTNLQHESYWTSGKTSNGTGIGFVLESTGSYSGYQGTGIASSYAMAVRSGDISPAPEPETYAMLLAGLGLIGAIARRRKGQQG